jgi:hypothetical protein
MVWEQVNLYETNKLVLIVSSAVRLDLKLVASPMKQIRGWLVM